MNRKYLKDMNLDELGTVLYDSALDVEDYMIAALQALIAVSEDPEKTLAVFCRMVAETDVAEKRVDRAAYSLENVDSLDYSQELLAGDEA